jgi:hypothetical protein
MMTRLRTIDYAAQAVRTALLDKFGRQIRTEDLEVEALDNAIRITFAGRKIEGTRDELMSAIRRASAPKDL